MDMFQKFNAYLEEEQEIREKIREIVRYGSDQYIFIRNIQHNLLKTICCD